MIPTFQDPFLPRTTDLLGYWIRCLLGKQPLRWLAMAPAEYRMQQDNYRVDFAWSILRTPAEIDAAYGLLEPIGHLPWVRKCPPSPAG